MVRANASELELSPPPLPVWAAPLVPVAIALTIGIIIDRFWIIPLTASLGIALTSLIAWCVFVNTTQKWLALVYLWGCVAGLGAAYHHGYRFHVDATNLSHVADHDGKPVRLRGRVTTAPIARPVQTDPMRGRPARATARFQVQVTQRQDLTTRTWHAASGTTQVTLIGRADDFTVGDEVEVLGRLALPDEEMNPGEFDYVSFLRDQGVTTTLTVFESDEAHLVRRAWPTSLFGWLAVVRGYGQRTLERDLAAQHSVASALLLGEGTVMTGQDWELYRKSGVLHVLAISGQHLAVLAWFLWLASRVIGWRRRNAAVAVAILLILYALMAGGRPPVMRAAWMVAVYAGSIVLQRPASHANTFALGWIGVLLLNPTDALNAGCQLSFLAVAVLMWGVGHWEDVPDDPLARVAQEAQSWPMAVATWVMRTVMVAYLINAAVWIAVSPLLAAHFHMFSPIALLIGPPMVVLTSLALLTGFAFLLFAGWCWPIAWLFALPTQWSLAGCEWLVSVSLNLPGAYWYVADVPAWWLWLFYMPLLIGICSDIPWQWSRWLLLAGCVWLALGVAMQLWPHRPGEFRCTFVAVGHGGCTVIETPNGRVIVYDAGATGGPDVTRRHIAPFLWSRGIRHIDDLILSHADLDHFNGVPQLVDRFSIGRVLCTPTFAKRDLPAAQLTVNVLERQRIPIEIVTRGRSWELDSVAFTVLHPPADGPLGKENVRSLVLHITHDGWSFLLTGDLEDAGLKNVLSRPAPPIDVLMAPHHGSDRSNISELAKWANPKLVVSCQTSPTSERLSVKMYEKMGAKYLGTWPHGAITIRLTDQGWTADTHRTKLQWRPK